MSKTKDELNNLKKEYEILTTKLKELSVDELKEVVGGTDPYISPNDIPGLETIGPTSLLGKSVNVNEVLTSNNNKNGNQ